MSSDTPNLDAAIAGTGPKVPFTPVFTLDDVADNEKRQLALIALIKTPKEKALETLEVVEQIAAAAIPVAFPALAPFVPIGKRALDAIEAIIERGQLDPVEDTKTLLELYAQFNAAGNSAAEAAAASPKSTASIADKHDTGHAPAPSHDPHGGIHHDQHGNVVDAHGNILHHSPKPPHDHHS